MKGVSLWNNGYGHRPSRLKEMKARLLLSGMTTRYTDWMAVFTEAHVGDGERKTFDFAHGLGTTKIEVIAYNRFDQLTMLNHRVKTPNLVEVEFFYIPKPGELTVEISS